MSCSDVFTVRAIGHVESPLAATEGAPRQADEDAPPAWLVFDDEVRAGLDGLAVGDTVIVLTWLDRARRDALTVHPRGDPRRPVTGVFNTRSPHRPNPIGLHETRIIAMDGTRLCVAGLDAVAGTPIIDLKPLLGPRAAR